MKKQPMVLVLGGLRIGDTFHAIPFLFKASKQFDITWHHGSYAGNAARLLQDCAANLSIVKTVQSNDQQNGTIPTDMNSILDFKKRIITKDLANSLNGCVLESDAGIITSANPSLTDSPDIVTNHIHANRSTDSILELKDPGNYQERWGDYIAVQPHTISSWKVQNSIYQVEYPLPIVSLGTPGERLVPKAKDGREDGFQETVKILKGARCVVAQHSAMACLSFYLNIPTIVLHFHKEGLFMFSKFHNNCRDLKIPNQYTIKQAIIEILEETNV